MDDVDDMLDVIDTGNLSVDIPDLGLSIELALICFSFIHKTCFQGKNGNYLYYRGDRTLDALDAFVMKYLKSRVHVPIITQIRGTERPLAYVLGDNRVGSNALTRIAFQLVCIIHSMYSFITFYVTFFVGTHLLN